MVHGLQTLGNIRVSTGPVKWKLLALTLMYTFGCQKYALVAAAGVYFQLSVATKYAYGSASFQVKSESCPACSIASRLRAFLTAADRFPAWLNAIRSGSARLATCMSQVPQMVFSGV